MSAAQNCAVANCKRPRHIGKAYCLEHHKEQDNYQYGIDAEIAQKLNAKLDPQKVALAQAWLEHITNSRFSGSLQDGLKSGVILCQAVNKIKPGSIKNISNSSMPFNQRENITSYLAGCRGLGMKEVDLFVTGDLYEGANMVAVVDNIYALSAMARKVGFGGPFIGVKQADSNPRNFDEEKLRSAANVPSRQTQGSYGYQDDTRNPTLDRQIVKNVSGHEASNVPSKQNQGSYGYQPENTGPAIDKIIRNPAEFAKARNQAAPASDKKFCTKCGTAAAGGNFCGSCGNKL